MFTGWKIPTQVTQNNKKAINGGRACYSFINLNNLKRNDNTYTDIPLSGGIDSQHHSPEIYTSGYQFNIPEKASIKQIQILHIIQQRTNSRNGKHKGEVTSKFRTIKLKTGASSTDGGIGNNKANNKTLQFRKWTDEKTGLTTYTPTQWGVPDITPSQINNSNFGCVSQWTGLYKNTWTTPAIRKIMMNIEYELPIITATATKDNKLIQSQTKINVLVNENDRNKLSLDQPDTPITLTVQYKHKGTGGQTPVLEFQSDHLLITDNKLTKTTLPTLTMESTDTEKTYTQQVKIYPETLPGVQKLDITHDKKHDDITINGEDTPPLNLMVQNSSVNTYTSISDFLNMNNNPYEDINQRFIVMNSTFQKNSATHKGGAIFVKSERFYRRSNTIPTSGGTANTASSGSPAIDWRGTAVTK
ncbi:MAG: hypothetical protein BZ136_07575 [Methanosphaera sp. rholeuAM74]|nr:MAG: hypothetical protein BZ136_07575 [Methanosphaera sp. rholeuAM74]